MVDNVFPVAFDNPLDDTIEKVASETDEDVSKRSPDSAAMVEYWDKTDAIVGGITTMRIAGKDYLPMFPSENDDDYNFRLKQTKITNIYRDVVEALAAKPFEQEITIPEESKTPKEIIDFLEDVDGRGSNLTTFSATTFFNGINSAIDWIMIDYPIPDPEKIKTMADQKRQGIRPFWTHVLGRNILHAEAEKIDGRETLTLVRILEPGTPDQIREFQRMEDSKVVWNLYEKRKVEGVEKWVKIQSGDITIGVIPLVPFYTGRRDGSGFRLFPAMQDACDLQIELYQQESALKYAKVLTAYPMLAGNGVTPDKDGKGDPKPISVGPNKVLYAPPNGNGQSGSWAYVEISASSLKFLKDDISDTKTDLRELGRQPLTAQSGNLTVITTAVAAGKAKSAVMAWTINLKTSLEIALKITAMWMKKENYEPEVSIYTEFDNFAEDGKDLDHLRSLREKGDLSQETLWNETKRRRVLSTEFDNEQEKERILSEVPTDDIMDDEQLDDDGNPVIIDSVIESDK